MNRKQQELELDHAHTVLSYYLIYSPALFVGAEKAAHELLDALQRAQGVGALTSKLQIPGFFDKRALDAFTRTLWAVSRDSFPLGADRRYVHHRRALIGVRAAITSLRVAMGIEQSQETAA
jgi:hypothetical protein